ncbi:hypothetical protein [Kitasatospora sp. NPDC098663]|uniref:hypothetical protein n=1 Tax=Kitasatospora sp. NPDC098663 TaxID=3364096 RepID=UPI00382F9361
MSIFATWLLLAEDGDGPAPLVYQGSHVSPADGHPRAGWLEVAAVPNHCHPRARLEGQEPLPVEFLRMSIGRPVEFCPGDEPDQVTVVLDRSQVQQLHDTLAGWLGASER